MIHRPLRGSIAVHSQRGQELCSCAWLFAQTLFHSSNPGCFSAYCFHETAVRQCLTSSKWLLQALLAGYLVYRTRCPIPKLEEDSWRQIHHLQLRHLLKIRMPWNYVFNFKLQDPGNLVLKVIYCENPFLRMQGRQLTFLQSCEGSYLHPVGKMRGLGVSNLRNLFIFLVAGLRVEIVIDMFSRPGSWALAPFLHFTRKRLLKKNVSILFEKMFPQKLCGSECVWKWACFAPILAGEDKVTTHLANLLELRSLKRLTRTEQLGFVVIGVYLRSALSLG